MHIMFFTLHTLNILQPLKYGLCCAWVHWFGGGLCRLATSMAATLTFGSLAAAMAT